MSTIFFTYTLFGKSLGVHVLHDWKQRHAFWVEPPYGEYPPGPTGSLSHTDTEVFTPHLFHTPPPSLHQCLLEQLKLKGERQTFLTQQHFSFILTSCFMISTPSSMVVWMLMVIKIIAKNVSWPRRDSNTQPSDLESDALPLRHGVHM